MSNFAREVHCGSRQVANVVLMLVLGGCRFVSVSWCGLCQELYSVNQKKSILHESIFFYSHCIVDKNFAFS